MAAFIGVVVTVERRDDVRERPAPVTAHHGFVRGAGGRFVGPLPLREEGRQRLVVRLRILGDHLHQ